MATHIPVSLDVPGLRTSLGRTEGYLSFDFTFSPEGEERTGWTDTRHPAMDGMAEKVYGYDRSDFNVNISTKVVTNGLAPPGDQSATPNIIRDFEYSSAVFAQAGISTIQANAQTLTNANYLTIGDPTNLDDDTELAAMFGVQRQANMVDAYYIQNFTDAGTLGWALSPEDGTVEKVFIDGWTLNSGAENWIARWLSPVDARFVRISELIIAGHDGNAQIDAIIAAVPEPATLSLLVLGGVALLRRRRG